MREMNGLENPIPPSNTPSWILKYADYSHLVGACDNDTSEARKEVKWYESKINRLITA